MVHHAMALVNETVLLVVDVQQEGRLLIQGVDVLLRQRFLN